MGHLLEQELLETEQLNKKGQYFFKQQALLDIETEHRIVNSPPN